MLPNWLQQLAAECPPEDRAALERVTRMAIPFTDAQKSPNHQRALLERDVVDYPAGTTVYASGKDDPHGGWRCVFPDGSWRVVSNDDIRLCW